MRKPRPHSAMLKACAGAKISLRMIPKRIAITMLATLGRGNLDAISGTCDLTPHQALKLGDELITMANVALERNRYEKQGGKS